MASVLFGSIAIVRRGSFLIIPVAPAGQPAILPPLCIKCGAPGQGKPVERTCYWHHPTLYLLILAGLLIYVIVAVVVRKNMRVRVSFCAQHAQRHSVAVTLAWVLPLIGIADAFILPQLNLDDGVVALISAALILSGLVIWAVAGNPIRPKSIDQYSGTFSGFCETFLQQFPENVREIPSGSPQAPPPPPPVN